MEKQLTQSDKIKADELIKEFKLLLKDNYLAKFYQQGQELHITFLNGQSFVLTLYETK